MRTSNIYYDLTKSEHFSIYKDLKFMFSSGFYKNKFDKEIISFIKEENAKIKSKYKCDINIEKLSALLLYQKIEKRDFKVYITKNNKAFELKKYYKVNFNLVI